MSLVSARRQLLMLIAGYAQELSSRHKDRRNRTHVDHSLTITDIVNETSLFVKSNHTCYYRQLISCICSRHKQ